MSADARELARRAYCKLRDAQRQAEQARVLLRESISEMDQARTEKAARESIDARLDDIKEGQAAAEQRVRTLTFIRLESGDWITTCPAGQQLRWEEMMVWSKVDKKLTMIHLDGSTCEH